MSVIGGIAVRFIGPSQVEVVDHNAAGPDAEEVLVETSISAISAGTEMLVYRGEVDNGTVADAELPALEGTLSYPLRYGYAAVGEVAAVGKRVDPDWRGRTVFGFNPHESAFTARPEELLAVPEGIAPERAAFLASVETAVNFMLDAAPRFGERVAVFGQGVVGLLTTRLLAETPLDRLVTVEPDPRRRALSASMGADFVVDPSGCDPAEAVRKSTGGVDVAIEISGRPAALEAAVEATRYDGRVIVGSWYGTKREPLALGDHFHRNRIDIESSQVSTIAPDLRGRWDRERRREVAWSHLAEIDVESLITHRLPVEKAPIAYGLLAEDPPEAVQILLTYTER